MLLWDVQRRLVSEFSDIKSSREHAEIAQVGKDYNVTDLESQNSVVVNDLKIKQHTLNEGDKVIW